MNGINKLPVDDGDNGNDSDEESTLSSADEND